MTDVEWLRALATQERGVASTAWNSADVQIHNDRANLCDRAADALALVERGRGAEALAIASTTSFGGGEHFVWVSRDIQEGCGETEAEAREHLAARLIATALKLLGTPTSRPAETSGT